MINGFFDKFNNDFLWANGTHPKYKSATEEEINVRMEAARDRMGGRAFVLGAVILTFSALPLLASGSGVFIGSGVIILAAAVFFYIFGHDVFKLAENTENHLNSHTRAETLRKALQSGVRYGEEALTESIARDFTNHTILQPFWMKLEILSYKRNDAT